MFSYIVNCSIADPVVAEQWLHWLANEHIQDVLNAGAESAEIFRMDGERRFEIRYVFSSRHAFEIYERDHAPRLRQEGLSKFPIDLGLAYSRTTGELVERFD